MMNPKRLLSEISLTRIAVFGGGILIALLVADVVYQLKGTNWKIVPQEMVTLDGIMAVFLLGLLFGVLGGVGLFFAALTLRERRLAEAPDELDLLIEELEAEEAVERDGLFSSEFESSDERAEQVDPWERPSDWWKSED